MVAMKVTIKAPGPIMLGERDGAFVFRNGLGLEVHIPSDFDENGASEESRTALLLAWIVRRAEILTELQQRFQDELDARPVKGRFLGARITIAPPTPDSDPEIRRITNAIEEVCKVEATLVTEESCLTDLRPREMHREQYQALLSRALDIHLDLDNPDHNYIVRLARQLRTGRVKD